VLSRVLHLFKQRKRNQEDVFDAFRAAALLTGARHSLEEFLASENPRDVEVRQSLRHKFSGLSDLYEQLRATDFDPSDPRYPTHMPDARDLYWDEPETEAWRKCIDDAFALFSYLRNPGSKE
jgi:hypothetical protein